MTLPVTNRPTDHESEDVRIRVARLERIVCELLIKNEQLRMAQRAAHEIFVPENAWFSS
jgi:hypothetical protein